MCSTDTGGFGDHSCCNCCHCPVCFGGTKSGLFFPHSQRDGCSDRWYFCCAEHLPQNCSSEPEQHQNQRMFFLQGTRSRQPRTRPPAPPPPPCAVLHLVRRPKEFPCWIRPGFVYRATLDTFNLEDNYSTKLAEMLLHSAKKKKEKKGHAGSRYGNKTALSQRAALPNGWLRTSGGRRGSGQGLKTRGVISAKSGKLPVALELPLTRKQTCGWRECLNLVILEDTLCCNGDFFFFFLFRPFMGQTLERMQGQRSREAEGLQGNQFSQPSDVQPASTSE